MTGWRGFCVALFAHTALPSIDELMFKFVIQLKEERDSPLQVLGCFC
jgi:hypothetical protein